MSPPADLELLLDRYVAGECSAADALVVRQWVGEDPERTVLIERLRVARAVERAQITSADVPRAVAALEAALDATRAPHPESRGPRASPGVGGGSQGFSGRFIGGFIAAGFVVTLGAVLVWQRTSAGRGQPLREFVREFASASGSRASLVLRDGTRLVLGPASRVRVPSDFGRTDRSVELVGEALFTVVHNAAHPFAVRTARAVTRDVGTTFVIRAYAGDPDDQVGVLEGEATVGGSGFSRGLSPTQSRGTQSLRARDLARVTDSGMVVTHGTDVAELAAWAQGRLVFRDTPLRDVARQLGRTFDLEVSIADTALAVQHVTGSYTDQPVDAILDDITAVIGAQYQRAGRAVVIRRRAGHRPGVVAPASSSLARGRA